LTVFGDLDLSIIDELPKGRKEIITKIVAPENRDKAYAFIRGQVRKGRQVFVICPRIEPLEEPGDIIEGTNEIKKRSWFWDDVKTAKEEYEKLSKKAFPDLKVGLLHGKLKAKEKAGTMKQFSNGAIDILVSTSVVEVGVDIPNATIMLIESAEKFGLSQLYQFRGRVGRGEYQSFCLLFTELPSKTVYKRLNSLIKAKNGFELAEMDLALRGPGEFLGGQQGVSQTGLPDLAMRALRSPQLVKESRTAAEMIITKDPELNSYKLLKERLEGFQKEIHLE
jgi:ATP-dependent DNA helicase RecG